MRLRPELRSRPHWGAHSPLPGLLAGFGEAAGWEGEGKRERKGRGQEGRRGEGRRREGNGQEEREGEGMGRRGMAEEREVP